MLEEFEIRKKWREICQRDRPKGCIIDSGAFAVELVRWVESGLTQRAADATLAAAAMNIANILDVLSEDGEE